MMKFRAMLMGMGMLVLMSLASGGENVELRRRLLTAKQKLRQPVGGRFLVMDIGDHGIQAGVFDNAFATLLSLHKVAFVKYEAVLTAENAEEQIEKAMKAALASFSPLQTTRALFCITAECAQVRLRVTDLQGKVVQQIPLDKLFQRPSNSTTFSWYDATTSYQVLVSRSLPQRTQMFSVSANRAFVDRIVGVGRKHGLVVLSVDAASAALYNAAWAQKAGAYCCDLLLHVRHNTVDVLAVENGAVVSIHRTKPRTAAELEKLVLDAELLQHATCKETPYRRIIVYGEDFKEIVELAKNTRESLKSRFTTLDTFGVIPSFWKVDRKRLKAEAPVMFALAATALRAVCPCPVQVELMDRSRQATADGAIVGRPPVTGQPGM